jgi:hypothetical protein
MSSCDQQREPITLMAFAPAEKLDGWLETLGVLADAFLALGPHRPLPTPATEEARCTWKLLHEVRSFLMYAPCIGVRLSDLKTRPAGPAHAASALQPAGETSTAVSVGVSEAGIDLPQPATDLLATWPDLLQTLLREATGEALRPAPSLGTPEAAQRVQVLRAVLAWVSVAGVQQLRRQVAAADRGDDGAAIVAGYVS